MNAASPSTLLLAFYGDDFTGSTDAMEALQWAGIRTLLFLHPPTAADLARFPDLRAFGVAGWSRSMSPVEMEDELTPVLERLRQSGAAIIHYKLCSTFDSSPRVGSIGKVMDIGRRIFGQAPIPMVIAAPVLGRYAAFGNLFARAGLDSEPYRLDRHPGMVRHPITPMNEADMRRHLAAQTDLEVSLCDILTLEAEDAEKAAQSFLASPPAAILFDGIHPRHLAWAGRFCATLARQQDPLFAIGSSGFDYAMIEHWRSAGLLPGGVDQIAASPAFSAVDQVLVMTGTCSPVNDRQIGVALKNGFREVPVHPARLLDDATMEAEIDAAVARATNLAHAGDSVILHSARGPGDPRIEASLKAFAALGVSKEDIPLHNGRLLGPRLGRIFQRLLTPGRFKRVGVAGGDTSGHVARALGIQALEALAPLAPGSPLCRVLGDSEHHHGLEIIFKGGQVGKDDVWLTLKHGTKR